jgi:hypothetical protein
LLQVYIMQIILSKDDIEEVVKNLFKLKELRWDAEGNLIIDVKPEDIQNKQW